MEMRQKVFYNCRLCHKENSRYLHINLMKPGQENLQNQMTTSIHRLMHRNKQSLQGDHWNVIKQI